MEIVTASSRPPDATLAVLATDPPSAQVAELVETGEVTTKRGAARTVQLDGERAIVVGGGPADEVDADALRDAAAAVVNELRASTGGSIAWPLDGSLSLSLEEQARAVVEGAVLGDYDPGAWKTETREEADVSQFVLVTESDVEDACGPCGNDSTVGESRAGSRQPARKPPTPASFAEYAAELAADKPGLSAEALEPDAMRDLGMGALLGVGAGSYNEPRLIVLRWEPPQAAGGDLVLGLVGKGLTFDSGGISLKPATHMEDMKGDMAGAAAVVAGIGALAELAVPVRAMAVVAAAENMPSGRSMRPGDILTAANGKTIEVTNTDAEGRLVLADALWYAREQGATHVVDFATLTGAWRARSATCTPACSPTMTLARRDRRRRQRERRLRLAVPAPSALSPHHRLGVRRHEELEPPPGRRPDLRHVIPRGVRRGGPWAHIDMAGRACSRGREATTCPRSAARAGACA